jgi:rod shape-determining protein MreC
MERLFLFIYQYRAFLTFLVLEFFCFWLIVENNRYQGANFFNSSNTVVASINNFSQSIRDYFLLTDTNRALSEKNAELERQLDNLRQIGEYSYKVIDIDTALLNRYEFISAKVVNNQVDRTKNFITINRGESDGIQPGMAVISPLGAVGKVKKVSSHFAVVTSVLNIDYMISAVLKKSNHFGTVQWNGRNPETSKLNYIPRHVKLAVGDTVVTSGFNAVFPEGVMVGTVSEVNLSPESLTYDLTILLSQDFRKLSYVSVVKSKLKSEMDELEQAVEEATK